MNTPLAHAQRILLIEDEKVLGEVITQTLSIEGYEVCWEQNGVRGLSKMRELAPDLVLLDLVMPEKDGYAVIEEMMQDTVLKHIPVIVISNSGQPVEVERILKMGVKECLVKAEFNPAEVLEKIRIYLGPSVVRTPVSASIATSTPTADVSSSTILIVEDDTFLSSIIVSRFVTEGYTVLLAHNGEEALALLEKQTPDLIMLDIVMPGLSGFDVLKKIRSNPALAGTLVLMFSNLGQEVEIEQAKSEGANGFIIKANATPADVVGKVKTLLAAHKDGAGTNEFIKI